MFPGFRSPAPALSSDGQRLAYSESVDDTAITRLQLPEGAGQPVLTKLIGSTRLDLHAEYSPDGKRIAFASNRSGRFDVWSSDRDGSNPVQLTSMSFPWCSSVRWSPDGHRILFTAIVGESSDIRVVDAEGGAPRALTSGPSDDLEANWSRDGESIYFTSNRGGQFQVWKVRAGGGDPLRSFEADLRSGELRKSGVKIKLRDQALQVLSELLERRGEVCPQSSGKGVPTCLDQPQDVEFRDG